MFLQTGTMEIERVLPWSSNYAFLVTVCDDEIEIARGLQAASRRTAVMGFSTGTLYLREQGALLVSEH